MVRGEIVAALPPSAPQPTLSVEIAKPLADKKTGLLLK
jgi:hypothetical protein